MNFRSFSALTFFAVNSIMFQDASFADEIPFNPSLVKKVESCKASALGSPLVLILKQWHLPASLNTQKSPPSMPLPQSKNLNEIVSQVTEWNSKGFVKDAVAEGCENSEINESFETAFNGWTVKQLKTVFQEHPKNWEFIQTHPLLKIRSKLGSAISITCGDRLSSIHDAELALSDAKGDAGFYSRVVQYKNDQERLTPYLEGSIDALKLKKSSSYKQVKDALGKDLKLSVKHFYEANHSRNVSFVEKAHSLIVNRKGPVVIVVGGLHAKDLKETLEKSHENCAIFEPISYQNKDEAMVQAMEEALKKL